MEKRIKALEKSLDDIIKRLDQIDSRIAQIEQKKSLVQSQVLNQVESESEETDSIYPKLFPGISRIRIFSVIGRTFLVLAGAFLLRAFTENQTFAPMIGALIGLVYALVWMFFSEHAARKKDVFSASFHGISSIIIAFPLVYEASTKLNIFSPAQTISILFVFTAIALIISAYRNLRSVYVLFVLAALATCFPLMITSGKVEMYTIFIVLIGISTLLFKYLRNWHVLPWISAFFVNLAIAFLVSLSSNPERLVGRYSQISPSISLTIIILYIIVYLSGFIIATLILKRQISIFGMFQSLFALIVGLIGAIAITHGTGLGYDILGIFTIIFSISFYLIAFKYLKPEVKVNFYYYTWMAFILATAAIWIVCSENVKIISLGIMSILSIILTKYVDRFNTLSIQSVLYLVLAAWFSGIIKFSVSAFVSPEQSFMEFSPILVFSLFLIILVYILHLFLGVNKEQEIQIPRFIVLLLSVTGIFGFVVLILVKSFALYESSVVLQKLALIRTIVLSISAILLAWLSNKSKLYEFSMLVYPILIIAGFKLLFEDLSKGTPMTLFVGFIIYGVALISAPKIKLKKRSSLS